MVNSNLQLDFADFSKFQVNIWETVIFALFNSNNDNGLVMISYICIEEMILNTMISKLYVSDRYQKRYQRKNRIEINKEKKKDWNMYV